MANLKKERRISVFDAVGICLFLKLLNYENLSYTNIILFIFVLLYFTFTFFAIDMEVKTSKQQISALLFLF